MQFTSAKTTALLADFDSNPRLNMRGKTSDWERFKESISEDGLALPIEVIRNKDNQLVVAHGFRRLLAIQELREVNPDRFEFIPVVVIEDQRKFEEPKVYVITNERYSQQPNEVTLPELYQLCFDNDFDTDFTERGTEIVNSKGEVVAVEKTTLN
jgi:hypothetical protein